MKKWHSLGVANYSPFALSSDDKKWFKQELSVRMKNSNLDDIESRFFTPIEHSLSMYFSAIELKQEAKPAQVRINLRLITEQLSALSEMFVALDGTSRSLIINELDEPLAEHEARVSNLYIACIRALGVANDFPERGKLPQHAMLQLAIDVVGCIHRFTQVRPTITHQGLYESLLSIVHDIALAHGDVVSGESQGVNKLLRRAIKTYHP